MSLKSITYGICFRKRTKSLAEILSSQFTPDMKASIFVDVEFIFSNLIMNKSVHMPIL